MSRAVSMVSWTASCSAVRLLRMTCSTMPNTLVSSDTRTPTSVELSRPSSARAFSVRYVCSSWDTVNRSATFACSNGGENSFARIPSGARESKDKSAVSLAQPPKEEVAFPWSSALTLSDTLRPMPGSTFPPSIGFVVKNCTGTKTSTSEMSSAFPATCA